MRIVLDEVVVQYTEEINELQRYGDQWGEVIEEFKFMETAVPERNDIIRLHSKRWIVMYVETDFDSGIIRVVIRHFPARTK